MLTKKDKTKKQTIKQSTKHKTSTTNDNTQIPANETLLR